MSRTVGGAAAVIAMIIAAAPLAAQDSPVADPAMQPLAWMVGDWSGGGWMQRGPQRSEFVGTEKVEARLGRLIVVEGEHHALQADGTRGALVHHALGVVSADSAGGHLFQTWLHDGPGTGAANRFEVTENGFRWWPAGAGDRVRFTATYQDGVWLEIGEFDTGTGWRQFFEMRMEREGSDQ